MRLLCGCCGIRYSGKQHWNYDRGYGLCESCKSEQEKEAEKELEKSIELVIGELNEGNKEKFLKMNRSVQAEIINRLFHKGVLKWVIK